VALACLAPCCAILNRQITEIVKAQSQVRCAPVAGRRRIASRAEGAGLAPAVGAESIGAHGNIKGVLRKPYRTLMQSKRAMRFNNDRSKLAKIKLCGRKRDEMGKSIKASRGNTLVSPCSGVFACAWFERALLPAGPRHEVHGGRRRRLGHGACILFGRVLSRVCMRQQETSGECLKMYWGNGERRVPQT
jgi:hypothetical protein